MATVSSSDYNKAVLAAQNYVPPAPKMVTPIKTAITPAQALPTPTPTPTGNVYSGETPEQTAARLAQVKAISAQRGEEQAISQGQTPTSTQTFNPREALAGREGTAPVSPFVNTGQPGTPGAPTTSGTVTTPTTLSPEQQAAADLTAGTDAKVKALEGMFETEEENLNEKVESYTNLYNTQLKNLEQLEKTMQDITNQKNALVLSSSELQKKEVETAYNYNAQLLDAANKRAQQLQKEILAEKENQVNQRKVKEENLLAVIGGFGSMAGNKMILDGITEGQKAITALKVGFNIDDQEQTAKVMKLNSDYQNDKIKIEQWKQEKITENYSSLQSYVEKVMRDRNLTEEKKVEAINKAKDEYNQNVSRINYDVINARFDLSREILQRTDQLKQDEEQRLKDLSTRTNQERDDARANLSLLMQNYGDTDLAALPQNVKEAFAELEVKAGLPEGFTVTAIENIKAENQGKNMQISLQTDNQGNVTVIGIDKRTGMVVSTSQVSGAGKASLGGAGYIQSNGNNLSKAVFTSGRLINEPIGSVDLNGVDVKAKATVIKKVSAADEAMKADGLEGLKIRSSFRTNDEQANIPGEATNAAAGESFHEAGQAIDVDNWKEAEPYLRAQGMVNDLSWDPGHFSIGETNKVGDGGSSSTTTTEEDEDLF